MLSATGGASAGLVWGWLVTSAWRRARTARSTAACLLATAAWLTESGLVAGSRASAAFVAATLIGLLAHRAWLLRVARTS